jgi:hypothetical protein
MLKMNGNYIIALIAIVFMLLIFVNQNNEPFCQNPNTDEHIYTRFPYNEYIKLDSKPEFKTYETPDVIPNADMSQNYDSYQRLTQDQYPYIEYQPKRDWPRFEELRY